MLKIKAQKSLKYVTLDHKTSLKSLEYICSNSQKYIVWVKIIDFSFMPKIIRTLSNRGGQSTQLHYLSESTDTAGQILLHYK